MNKLKFILRWNRHQNQNPLHGISICLTCIIYPVFGNICHRGFVLWHLSDNKFCVPVLSVIIEITIDAHILEGVFSFLGVFFWC